METKSPEAMEVRRLNHQIDCLLEMARQKMTRPTLEENLQIHREIGEVLNKWQSEGLTRIHPSEVQQLTIYQYQLLGVMDRQREVEAIIEQSEILQEVAETRMGLPQIMHRGFTLNDIE